MYYAQAYILGIQLASYVYVARATMSDYQRLLDATGNYQWLSETLIETTSN